MGHDVSRFPISIVFLIPSPRNSFYIALTLLTSYFTLHLLGRWAGSANQPLNLPLQQGRTVRSAGKAAINTSNA